MTLLGDVYSPQTNRKALLERVVEPTVQLTAPVKGDKIDDQREYPLAATVTGGAVNYVEFRRCEAPVAPGTATCPTVVINSQPAGARDPQKDYDAPYSGSWSAAGMTKGTYLVKARAYYNGGSVESPWAEVVVDNPPPPDVPVRVTAPAAGDRLVAGTRLAAEALDPRVAAVTFLYCPQPAPAPEPGAPCPGGVSSVAAAETDRLVTAALVVASIVLGRSSSGTRLAVAAAVGTMVALVLLAALRRPRTPLVPEIRPRGAGVRPDQSSRPSCSRPSAPSLRCRSPKAGDRPPTGLRGVGTSEISSPSRTAASTSKPPERGPRRDGPLAKEGACPCLARSRAAAP